MPDQFARIRALDSEHPSPRDSITPAEIETPSLSPWLARKDTDWWLDQLYEFAATLDATIISNT